MQYSTAWIHTLNLIRISKARYTPASELDIQPTEGITISWLLAEARTTSLAKEDAVRTAAISSAIKKYSLYNPILSYVCILTATYSILCTLYSDAFGTPPLKLCGPGCLNRYSDSLRAVRPGIEPRWGTRHSAPIQTGPGAHAVSCKIDNGSLPRG